MSTFIKEKKPLKSGFFGVKKVNKFFQDLAATRF